MVGAWLHARSAPEVDNDYEYNVKSVREVLAKQAKRYPLLKGLVYTSMYDFLAQHGVDYRPAVWTNRYAQGAQKECFANALTLASQDEDVKYVEGVALAPFGQVFAHAWNATAEGELVDTTWGNTGLVYIGVEFSVERADDATWNGDAHILNDEHRGYPVFQKQWEGEDYAREWPPSDRIEAWRRWKVTGEYVAPISVLHHLLEQRLKGAR